MEYHSISNPVWVDESHTMITIDIVFPSLGDAPVKFNASDKDCMDYGRAIHADLIAGKYGQIAEPKIESQ
jgi:hypothetical protein